MRPPGSSPSCPGPPTSPRPTRRRTWRRAWPRPCAATTPCVDEIVVEQRPDAAAIAAVRDRAGTVDLVVIGTIDGHRQPEQLALLDAVAATGTPTVAVALRGPWDVARYPAAVTALATYSILPPSLAALADVLAGRASATGRLPVTMTA